MSRATTAVLSLGPAGMSIDFDGCAKLDAFSFVLEGPPQPKERARRGKGGRWYTPARTRKFEKAIRDIAELSLMAAMRKAKAAWPMNAKYRVFVDVFFGDARRRDGDNVYKAVTDAMNKVAYADDSMIKRHAVNKEIDRARPRTEVRVEVIR